MPPPPVPDDVQEMLRLPNPCVMTSLRPDGSPVSVPTWYLWERDGRVLVNMAADRRRRGHLTAEPRTTLTVLDGADWSAYVTLEGRVGEWAADPDLAVIDRLARHYRGVPYPYRDAERVSAWVTVDRWHGRGIGTLGKPR